jgi:putative heme transporter
MTQTLPEQQTERPPSGRKQLIALAFTVGLSVVILAALAIALPGLVSYEDVWRALKQLSWIGILAVSVATLINILTYGLNLMPALPGLRYRAALAAALASSASKYVAPGGPAVGLGVAYLMLRAWRFARRRVTLALSVVTIWEQLITVALPPVALLLLRMEGRSDPLLVTVSLIGLGLFAVVLAVIYGVLHSSRFAQRIGDFIASIVSAGLRLARRAPVSGWGDQLAQFRTEALGLVRKRWHWLTLGTLAGHLSTYLVLIVTLRAIGVDGDEVSLAEAFAAWSVSRVLGGIPILPSGVGVVEVALTTALIGFGGNEAGVVASVLVYRFLTVVVPLVCGAIAGALWRRHHPREAELQTAAG